MKDEVGRMEFLFLSLWAPGKNCGARITETKERAHIMYARQKHMNE
jgi:hypothetical protein